MSQKLYQHSQLCRKLCEEVLRKLSKKLHLERLADGEFGGQEPVASALLFCPAFLLTPSVSQATKRLINIMAFLVPASMQSCDQHTSLHCARSQMPGHARTCTCLCEGVQQAKRQALQIKQSCILVMWTAHTCCYCLHRSQTSGDREDLTDRLVYTYKGTVTATMVLRGGTTTADAGPCTVSRDFDAMLPRATTRPLSRPVAWTCMCRHEL